MRPGFIAFALTGFLLGLGLLDMQVHAEGHDGPKVQLGPRPFYLVDRLSEGSLKNELRQCAAERDTYRPKLFSIGHRGAPLQFPEHTEESYRAAARMGAGILECDVTFTKDAELVCRHAQCDLHTTTDIVLRPELAAKCAVPPELDPSTDELLNAADIKCCASDLTVDEFLSLKGKMDAADRSAVTLEGYVGGTAEYRTDLYTTGGTLLTHAQSIELFQELGTGFTPELKGTDREEGFGESGLDQESYARKLIQEYIDAGILPEKVWPQSFDLDDVLLWVDAFPDYGAQAVFLDGRSVATLASSPPSTAAFLQLKERGVKIIAPPMPVLLTTEGEDKIVPSAYAKNAKSAGLEIISWTAERSGRIVEEGGGYYYQTTTSALKNDGDILRTIDVLAQQVGIIGLFSDWPATTTFYANCKPTKSSGRHGKRRGDDR